jgi:hypothetical protein
VDIILDPILDVSVSLVVMFPYKLKVRGTKGKIFKRYHI